MVLRFRAKIANRNPYSFVMFVRLSVKGPKFGGQSLFTRIVRDIAAGAVKETANPILCIINGGNIEVLICRSAEYWSGADSNRDERRGGGRGGRGCENAWGGRHYKNVLKMAAV
ncbi:hypothetical protein EVAR_5255_1 [Eumeta japonica]|uniref:Uncharacterized protein n=1 Tax=Eumeta variegata TaxID=151549 RepID=A0A4C1XSE5_EUMVA|nr:hypothetical protein EVAR_5255_1 [Eumeta japonica]